MYPDSEPNQTPGINLMWSSHDRSVCETRSGIKVLISEFGLSVLMLILLNHYMLIEFVWYLHDNKRLGNQ